MREGLQIRAVATSARSEELAISLGMPIVSFSEADVIDITIDGADEVDTGLNLIKGGGGALLREKIVASASRQLIVVVDESKLVGQLGRFPLPVEVVPFGYELTLKQISKLGCSLALRMAENRMYVTDNGNYIADCQFGSIPDPAELGHRLNMIPGVVENGLFTGMAGHVIVGYQNGHIKEMAGTSSKS